MNRITAHAEKVREIIAAGGKNGALDSAEKVAEFERTQDIDSSEHFAYQTAQSRAFAAGKMTQDEAQTIYMALGPILADSNGGWASHVDLALKVTITTLMGELMLGRRAA